MSDPLREFQERINRVDTSIRNEYDLTLIGDLFADLKSALAAHPGDDLPTTTPAEEAEAMIAATDAIRVGDALREAFIGALEWAFPLGLGDQRALAEVEAERRYPRQGLKS